MTLEPASLAYSSSSRLTTGLSQKQTNDSLVMTLEVDLWPSHMYKHICKHIQAATLTHVYMHAHTNFIYFFYIYVWD